MCGKEADLVLVSVEGVEMNLCSGCSKFGVIKKGFFQSDQKPSSKIRKDEPEFNLVANFASLIKSSREKKNLNQEDFAKFLNERVSFVAKWESGKLRPSVDTARRLERLLGLKLVEGVTEKSFEQEKSRKNNEFTLGDFVKVRKRK